MVPSWLKTGAKRLPEIAVTALITAVISSVATVWVREPETTPALITALLAWLKAFPWSATFAGLSVAVLAFVALLLGWRWYWRRDLNHYWPVGRVVQFAISFDPEGANTKVNFTATNWSPEETTVSLVGPLRVSRFENGVWIEIWRLDFSATHTKTVLLPFQAGLLISPEKFAVPTVSIGTLPGNVRVTFDRVIIRSDDRDLRSAGHADHVEGVIQLRATS